MEINVTLLSQMLFFFIYVLLCIKYVWPYINDVIEKRQRDIILEQSKIKDAKKKLLEIEKKIQKILIKTKNKSAKIISNAKYNGLLLINNSKIKAKHEYNKILLNIKNEIDIEKKKLYKDFSKNISNIINLILIEITENIFDKNSNNKFINKIINKYKINL